MDDSDSRIVGKDLSECLDLFESTDPDVQRIIACLQRTNRLTDNVIECLDKCSESTRKEILHCLLLNEFETIENELTNIQNELVNIQNRTLSCETDSVLTCGQFIPGNIQTIATDREGNIVDTPTATKHSQLGQLFGASDSSNIPTLFGSRTLQITNPANSGKVLHIERVVGGILGGDYAVNLFQNADPITDPTPPAIVNRNWSSTSTSTAAATASSSSASGGLLLQNTAHVAGYFELEFKGELVIPSAATPQTFTVEIQNFSQAIIGVAFTVVWSETA